jgi:hypothetical protein
MPPEASAKSVSPDAQAMKPEPIAKEQKTMAKSPKCDRLFFSVAIESLQRK